MSRLRRLAPRSYMAGRNLMRTRARTALAILTIVIGVVALASLGAIGAAFEAEQREFVEDFGSQIEVTPGEDAEAGLTDQDVREIERIAGDAAVYTVVTERVETDESQFGRTIYGIDDPGLLVDADRGSIPADWRTGAIVGHQYAVDNDVEPNRQVTVGDRSFRVQAVLEDAGFVQPFWQTGAVVVPQSELDADTYDEVYVDAEDPQQAVEIGVALEEQLNTDREERAVVQFDESAGAEFEEFIFIVTVFLLSVGGISLLVAGVSITNVMLMAAMERREEIGVLRAVGYRRRDVLAIMLTEGTLLGVAGTVVGLAISVVIAAGINSLIVGEATIPPGAVDTFVLAGAVGVGISVLASIYPAWKASRARPVEALRG